MAKSRSFSIYLLKQGYDASNSLKDDHSLEPETGASGLPQGASLFLLDKTPYEPWWKGYFGISKPLTQTSKGALVFLPVANRCFALSFGFVYHNLHDSSYEYDFGLRVTLNSVDPKKLKSTDILEPGAARRQRTQVPVDSDLTYFDFDRDSTILKSLTGKVKDEYKDYFKHATGASNLHLNSTVTSAGLVALCEKLLELYANNSYRDTFPDIQNISPVRDPVLIKTLSDRLLEAFRAKDENLYLTVPDIVEYKDSFCASFTGAGSSLIYEDVYLARYYEYLESNSEEINAITIDDLKRHSLHLADENGVPHDSYSVLKSMIFDTQLDAMGGSFHLCDGNWYKVEAEYITKLTTFLDPLCSSISLPPYTHPDEGTYNKNVAAINSQFLCFDEMNISPANQTQVEPCDLYAISDGHAVFHHIKLSTFSAQLSHLFNQGVNAIELIRSENQALLKLKALITQMAAPGTANQLMEPLDLGKCHVVYGIVTHKPPSGKSANLPLFSRISLMRIMKTLRIMSVRASFGFIPDQSTKADGQKKPRRKSA